MPARRRRKRTEWKLKAGVVCAILAPVLLLNVSVAFFGNSVVWPLSPFFLRDKASALALYAKHRATCWWSGHPDLGPLIAAAERKHKIPRHLLAALIEVESEGRAHRISFAGAMGVGQVVPGTARLMGLIDPFDSASAVDASGRYLAAQLERTGSPRLALAAYNAGPGNVHGVVPRNGETEYYVEKVMSAWRSRR